MTLVSITADTTADDAVAIVERWVATEVPAAWRTAATQGPAALRAVARAEEEGHRVTDARPATRPGAAAV